MDKKQIDLLRAVGRYSHIGFLMGVMAVGGFFLGRWVDGLLWKAPVFSILFFLVGFGLVFYRFILLIQEDADKDSSKRFNRRR